MISCTLRTCLWLVLLASPALADTVSLQTAADDVASDAHILSSTSKLDWAASDSDLVIGGSDLPVPSELAIAVDAAPQLHASGKERPTRAATLERDGQRPVLPRPRGYPDAYALHVRLSGFMSAGNGDHRPNANPVAQAGAETAALVVEASPQSLQRPSLKAQDLQAQAQPQPPVTATPLQVAPTKLFNLETANQLPGGTLSTAAGVRFFFTDEVGLGTGLQVYNASIDGGVTDQFQLGLGASVFDDTLGRLVNGRQVDLQLTAIAPNFKVQLTKDDRFALGLAGSVELLRIYSDPGLFNATADPQVGNHVVGTLQIPATYSLDPALQVHFTPGVAFYPGTLNNAPFFGTVFNLGAGVSWQPLEQLNLFADLNAPVTGGNAVRSADGSIFRRLVWSAGLRYLVNPSVGLDLYATNAFGTTPATRLLSFVPDGDQTAIGLNVNYTPEFGQGYAPSFRQRPLVPLGRRDAQLLLDGITLSTADTLLPEMLRLRGGLGAGDGVNVAYGLTNDLQVELIAEQFREGEDPDSDVYKPGLKVGPAVKLRFLDQVQGDPFSLGLKAAIAADLSSSVGLFAAELPFLYRLNSQVALSFNPKAAFVQDRALVGTGLGVNYALTDGLQLIGELTPLLTGQNPVWSVGARYFSADLGLGVDVYGSNAIGQNTLGGLVAQSDGGASVGFNLHWLIGGARGF